MLYINVYSHRSLSAGYYQKSLSLSLQSTPKIWINCLDYSSTPKYLLICSSFMGNEHPLLQQIAHHEQHRSVEISPTSKCLKHPYNKTDSLHLKIGHPKRESSLPFSGAMLVLGGVTWLAIEWLHLEGEDSSMSY